MADDATKHLFVLGFPDSAAADAAINELTELKRDQFLDGVKDYAVVSKAADGTLTVNENKEADPGGRRGAVTGDLAGAFVALAGPIGLGAVAVGAGVGAVAAVLRDSGFKNKDLDDVGSMMEAGRTLLLMAVSPHDADRLRSVLDEEPEFKAADRRWEATLGPDTKNVLHEAIAQFRAEQSSAPAEAETETSS